MSDLSYSSMLRNLSSDYYYHRISREEYRAQRREILDKIDEEFNGRKLVEEEDVDQAGEQNDQSIFMKTIAFFRNKDLED